MKWRIGLRGADIYFDSRVDEPIAAASGGGTSGVFERRDTNNYWGIGPHGALEIERRLTQWGLLAIGRLEGSILLGRINQGFFETSTTHGGGGQFLTGQSLESNAGAVPEIEGNLGLGCARSPAPLYASSQGMSTSIGGTLLTCRKRVVWVRSIPRASCCGRISIIKAENCSRSPVSLSGRLLELKSPSSRRRQSSVHDGQHAHCELGIVATRGDSGHFLRTQKLPVSAKGATHRTLGTISFTRRQPYQ